MAEYIEREATMTVPVLPKEHREYQTFNLDDAYEQGWNDALENLVNVPTADVAPVRHGRWERTEDGAALCTACNRKMNPSQYGYAFCSLCGAIMDG